ncbi:MAG: phospholipase D-like domain-containing protein [Anaerolineae bacterium]|jgi:phosphatidylserine/phosphatidylglycerophosphate/cardiolipin synthase-like enzyme
MNRDNKQMLKTGKTGWLAAATGFVAMLVLAVVYLLSGGEAANPAEYVQGLPAAKEGAASSQNDDPILVFFTDPAYPDDPADHRDGLDEALAADIDRAQASVDVAAYDFDLESVAEALVAAYRRGVRVRMVTDSDNTEELGVRQLRSAGVPVIEDGRDAIMHNKFVVIDGQVVWTGSWNLTESGTYRNNNHVARIASGQLSENYTAEFEEMFEEREFGPDSPASTPHPQLVVADGSEEIRIESYFAPEDRVADRLVELLAGAEDSIRFMAFSFTDDRLGDEMIRQHEAGLTVQGVFEGRNADPVYSEFGRMVEAQPRMDVRLDGNTYMMHHKVIIVDDKAVALGSFNFSEAADTVNDENLLIIYDRGIASLFRAEFRRIYREALEGRE